MKYSWRIVVLSLALAGVLFAGTQGSASAMGYVRGWSVQGSWLCYGWSNGIYHCTQQWYRDSAGHLISRRPNFVPSQVSNPAPNPSPQPAPMPSGGACPGGGLSVVGYVANGMHWAPGGIPNDSCAAVQAAPYGGALSLWKVPPAPFNRVYYVNPKLYPSRVGWPICAWWGRELNPHYAFGGGLWGQSRPRVGATVRYAPGVLGAGSGGHVGHVVAVYTNGWFLSSEMNFYWRGGGAGKVIFRFVHPQRGVTFVY